MVRYDLRFRRAEMTVQLNERDGSPMAWVCGALADGPGPAPPPDQALRVAEAAADLPLDAVLAGAAYDSVGGRQVFVAEWEHHQDGVPVERDYVRVMVSADSGRAFAVHRRWHRVDPDWTLR